MVSGTFKPLDEARAHLAAGRRRAAFEGCQIALKDGSENPDALFILGVLAFEERQPQRALQYFKRSVDAGHPEAAPHAQAARCFIQLNAPALAMERIKQAELKNPQDPFTLSSIGSTLASVDRHDRAISYFRKAVDAAPQSAVNHYNLASSLLFMGDKVGAVAAYREAIRLSPNFLPATALLAMNVHHTAEDNDLNALETAWANRNPRDLDGGRHLAHAIARVYEDLGDIETAMDWLEKGKAPTRAVVPNRQSEDQACFEAAKALASSLEVPASSEPGGPVFVLGLPRSGTTLVDRILTSHSGLISAGERPEFIGSLAAHVKSAIRQTIGTDLIESANSADLASIGQAYTKNLRAIVGSGARFTDKMPINALFVPAILAALPSACVICLRRNPADNVLGVYRQFFTGALDYYHYALDLRSAANYVAKFHELVDTYEQHLPSDRFTVVDYETLVRDTETETRRLLDFCDLEFEDATLNFHKNTAHVSTASVSQVRQPIYSTSIDRWKDYRPAIDPALNILKAAGLFSEHVV